MALQFLSDPRFQLFALQHVVIVAVVLQEDALYEFSAVLVHLLPCS